MLVRFFRGSCVLVVSADPQLLRVLTNALMRKVTPRPNNHWKAVSNFLPCRGLLFGYHNPS